MPLVCPRCSRTLPPQTDPPARTVLCVCGERIVADASRPPAPGTAPSVDMSPQLPHPARLGGYRLVRLIAQGGMGTVYEAVQESLKRTVALKILPPTLVSQARFVQRFQRESAALAQLKHPNIVSIIDRGVEEQNYYFVMEFVEGPGGNRARTLRDLIPRGRIRPAEAARYARQVASALAYAHSRGVIHRDVKPSNILVDERDQARLVDFGIAHLTTTERDLTLPGAAVGTPQYMAPEQRSGSTDIDPRTDIFALGVVIYEMLTGVKPEGAFEAPSRLAAGLDPRWDALVERALQRDRERRHPSMTELERGLAELEAASPAPAAPAPCPVVVGRCPSCNTDNPPDARFCAGCGRNVIIRCPACDAENRVGSRFCGACAVDIQSLDQIRERRTLLAESLRIGRDAALSFSDRRRSLLRARDLEGELASLEGVALSEADPILRDAWKGEIERVERGPSRARVLEALRGFAADFPDEPGVAQRLSRFETERRDFLSRLALSLASNRYAAVMAEGTRPEWKDDPEVISIVGEAQARKSKAKSLVKERLPQLLKARRFMEISAAVREIEELGVAVTGLDAIKLEASREIDAADRLCLEAEQLRGSRDLEGALKGHHAALARCADHERSAAAAAEIDALMNEFREALARAAEALEKGRPSIAANEAKRCLEGWENISAREILDQVGRAEGRRRARRRVMVALSFAIPLVGLAVALVFLRSNSSERRVARLIEEADADFRSRNLREAEEKYEEALRSAPGRAEAQAGLAEIRELRQVAAERFKEAERLAGQDDWTGARAKAIEALSLDPELEPARRFIQDHADRITRAEGAAARAGKFMAAQNYKAALECYDEALALDPDNPSLREGREKAASLLEEIDDRLSRALRALAAARPREAQKLALQVLERVRDHAESMRILAEAEGAVARAGEFAREGDKHMAFGKFGDAEKAYQEALAIDSENGRALQMLEKSRKSSAAPDQPADEALDIQVSEFLPLIPGTEWKYQVKLLTGSTVRTYDRKDRVSGKTREIGDAEAREIEVSMYGKLAYREYFSATQDKLLYHGSLQAGGAGTLWDPPVVLLRRSVRAGEKWTEESVVNDVLYTIETSIGPIEQVVLEIGTVKACRISVRYLRSDGHEIAITAWYASGVGKVKETQQNTGGGELALSSESMLVGFTPGKSEAKASVSKSVPGRAQDPAILEALKWLARHQEPGGGWRAEVHTNRCFAARGYAKGGRCPASGSSIEPDLDVGVTGLALLAFLGAGYGLRSEDTYSDMNFGDTVRTAVLFLMENQTRDGLIGNPNALKALYGHAIATYALAKALESAGGSNEELRPCVERAVALLVGSRRDACRDCGGTGRGPRECSSCGGSKKCIRCNALGHQHSSNGCGVCDGTVTWEDTRLYCISCAEKSSGKCATCHGDGTTTGNRKCSSCAAKPGKCTVCGGTGAVAGSSGRARACSGCLRVRKGSGKCLECAQTGLSPCTSCRDGRTSGGVMKRGWRYRFDSDESDASVTSWCLMALAAARSAGISVDKEVVSAALGWLEAVTDERSGRVGYTGRGTGKVIVPGKNEYHEDHPALTAAGIAARLTVGGGKPKTVAAGVELVMRDLPKEADLSRDYYYWYYGSVMLFLNNDSARWGTWKTSLGKTLKKIQKPADGSCAAGSWDPSDRWGMLAGRVYATALNALTLEYLTLAEPFGFPKAPAPETKSEERKTGEARWLIHLVSGGKVSAVSYEERDGKIVVELVQGGKVTVSKDEIERIEEISAKKEK